MRRRRPLQPIIATQRPTVACDGQGPRCTCNPTRLEQDYDNKNVLLVRMIR